MRFFEDRRLEEPPRYLPKGVKILDQKVNLAAIQSHVSKAIQNLVQLALEEKVEVISANQADKKRVQHLLEHDSALVKKVRRDRRLWRVLAASKGHGRWSWADAGGM